MIGFMLTKWSWWIHVTSVFATLISWTLVLAMGFSASDRWPHYGSLGNFERFVIFLAGSFITRATITNHETRMQLSCWAASAIIVEVARQWVSGRSNGIMGWLASVIGAGIGAISARHIAHNDFWRWGW